MLYLCPVFSTEDDVVSQDSGNKQEQQELQAAFAESAALGAQILSDCIQGNKKYFQSNPDLYGKVNERLARGKELSEAGNHRAANIIQRHAIDLILQEHHKLFKNPASLRKALLQLRDHNDNVIAPLWERQKANIS
jgi:hypothetical protein